MWRSIPGILFLIIIAVLLFSTYKKGTKLGGSELIGMDAPRLQAHEIEGLKRIPDSEILFKHQYVLVNFFASWCTPCLAEHPYLNQLSVEYPVKMVGIAWRDSAANIKQMLEKHGNPYDYVGLDVMDASAYGYGVVGLPETFLIGPDGKIISSHRGPLVPQAIKDKILPHIPTMSEDNVNQLEVE